MKKQKSKTHHSYRVVPAVDLEHVQGGAYWYERNGLWGWYDQPPGSGGGDGASPGDGGEGGGDDGHFGSGGAL